MLTRHSVLVVDPLDETHEVLRAALGRNVDVLAARTSAEGLALARNRKPSLVVLDLECDDSSATLLGRLSGASASHPTPMVLLAGPAVQTPDLPDCEILSKPYHYAPLIRRIEELLGGLLGGACQPVRKAA